MKEKRQFEVHDKIQLEDGKHKGVITGIAYRDKPYEYTDILIELYQEVWSEVGDRVLRLKAGYPSWVSEQSKFGRLFQRFGVDLVAGKLITPKDLLVGKEVEFQTITESTAKGEFTKIIPDSLKPKK